MEFAALQVTSNFTFLHGASHPEELVEQAAALGYKAIALTDHNTLAGIVRAHVAAKEKAVRFIPACRLNLMDGPPLLAYPTDTAAYARLSALLTKGNRDAPKGSCYLYREDVYAHAEGIRFVAIPPEDLDADFNFERSYVHTLMAYKQALGTALYLGASFLYNGNDTKRLHRIAQWSARYKIPVVALNDVCYHIPQRRMLQDVLTCIRHKCTIHTAGFRLHANAERYLKPIDEMYRLFNAYPEWLQETNALAEACTFSLDELKYIYPEEIVSEGRSPIEELRLLAWQGARERFGTEVPEQVQQGLIMELDFIERKQYASYFLTVYDLVRFARQRGILCQGRGSAANSVVCYCLGITSVNPTKFRLLFARFMSDARDEPPDIDVDFEHERREEVIQYIYQKYGRHRAGIVATVTQVHWKGAVRDVAKAMGLSLDMVDKLAKSGHELNRDLPPDVRIAGFDLKDPLLRKVLAITQEYIGFPRQLGQHTGGFVITQNKLSDLCPIVNARMEQRTCIEWNKDDIEALGFLKVDVLALGMLTCIRKAFELARQHYGLSLTLANIPQDDPRVYDMVSMADTMGVFQIESRAQMSMLPRLRPRCFYDLVIEVALVRPGPIQGDMVHPYLKRRRGEEPVIYPSAELENILGRTLGVPLFQEQAMEIAIVAAGFTPAQADGLRRSMATFKAKGKVAEYEQMLVSGMVRKGYDRDFAQRVFRQLEGFGSYGFPESHAASFALLVYVSSWIKCYYPDIFAAALLNSQPMGFYGPAQLVADARRHGVQVLPVDVNYSFWDNSLEGRVGSYCALRLGFRQIKGLRAEDASLLVAARSTAFRRIEQLLYAGISVASLERLAEADAFRSMGLDRRAALWEIAALPDHPTGIFRGQESATVQEEPVTLPPLSPIEHVLQDYSSTALSLKAHPLSFVRARLNVLQVTPAGCLKQMSDRMLVKVCGLITVRQRPGTAKGVLFLTLEDDTGFVNVVVWSKVFERCRRLILQSRLLMVAGHLQVEGEVIHVVAHSCFSMDHLLQAAQEDDSSSSANAAVQPPKWVQGTLFPSRDFK